MLTIGSLFSGIGGLELGLEWAGLGPVVWQVERDDFCRRKLSWRYPDAQRFEDVKNVGASNLPPVDLICGGFPCQDISSAGKRAGLAGARSGLWHEFARVVAECRPQWVVVENVASGAAKWVDPVRGALERAGYATLPIPIAAEDCGAPHERARVFIVACRAADADHQGQASARSAPAHADRAVVRQQPRRERWKDGSQAPLAADPAADANRARQLQPEERADERGRPLHRPGHWTAEPGVVRMVHGFPERVAYERALGNSVVPQCAEVVGRVIVRLATPE